MNTPTVAKARFFESGVGVGLRVLGWVVVPFIATNIVLKLVLPEGQRELSNLVKVAVLVAAYWAFVRFSERRAVHELSLTGALRETFAGLALGGLLFTAVAGALAALGAYSVDSVGSGHDLGVAAASLLPKLVAGAVIEELAFRLLLLRLVERSLGTRWALILSSAAFGLAHLGNDGATPMNSLALGLELGLLFGAAYVLTRRLWFCMATHLAWNFVQGGVFSIAVSGHSAHGWLQGTLTGPPWLTGGAFGAEGSVVALVVCTAAAGALLLLSRGHAARREATKM